MPIVSTTPDINCFVGSPYVGADGNWHCQGDVVAPATRFQIAKMNIPPFIKMQLSLPDVKPDVLPALPPINYKNCTRHQAPPNYTYVWNGSGCTLVALADAPAYIKQLQQQGNPTTGGGTGSATGGGGLPDISGILSAHPMLALAGVAAAVYLFANKGMKPKSREVVSTTKY